MYLTVTTRSWRRPWAACALLLALAGSGACSRERREDGVTGGDLGGPDEPDLFDSAAPFARPRLCERVKDDAVRDIFCADEIKPVTSLRQLQGRLSLNTLSDAVDDKQAESLALDPFTVVDDLVYLGHSTALSGQLVSPINPRALLLGRDTFLAYQRGIQQVEVITKDRETGGLNFYLVSFKQACNDLPAGCKSGDLYTQHVERDWIDVALRDDEELKNTPSDCRQCHQRGRHEPLLLMRELRGPWTHFFGPDYDHDDYQASGEVNGRDLTRDFLRAKGGEAYAGLPAFLTKHTAGASLQNRVGSDQPLNFESEPIDLQLYAAALAGTPRRSKGWDQAYQAFKRGERLALPHFEPRPTDPAKQAALTDAYVRYRQGELPREQLPDLRDIFPDDPQTRAEIGLQTEPEASGAELLVQACGSCHNDVLDQTVSRARFNIALARMSREELDLAMRRVQLARSHARAMPPESARQLDAAGRERLLKYLKKNQRSAADDALLESAAELGMARDPYNELGL